MKYYIFHPQSGSKEPARVECKSLQESEAEYKRLQEIYPSREMSLIVVNDWNERTRIHSGRWE